MADEIAHALRRARTPTGTAATSRSCSELYRIEMPHFIDRNLDSPLQLVRRAAARPGAHGRVPPAGPKVATYFARRAAAPAVLVPGDVRRAGARAGARDLRGDHLHGLRRAACTSRRAACTPCRARWPTPPRSTASRSATARRSRRSRSGDGRARGGDHRRDGERIPADVVVVNADLPTAYASCCPPSSRRGGCGGCATRRRRRAARRLAGARYADTAHHTIDFGARLGRDVRRDHRPRPADERPVLPAHARRR